MEDTSGWFYATSFVIDIPVGNTGDVIIHDISFPADILLWQIDIYTDGTANGNGDTINMIAGPDTIVGVITVDANISDTVLTVSSTVLEYVSRGIDITISNGVNKNELGYITAIDKINSTVTIKNALTNNFTIGSVICLNVHTIKNLVITELIKEYSFGKKGFRGKQVPANTIMRLVYTNNANLDKKIACKIECYIIG